MSMFLIVNFINYSSYCCLAIIMFRYERYRFFFHQGLYAKKFLSQLTIDPTKLGATSLTSIVDLAIQVCLDDFKATTPP